MANAQVIIVLICFAFYSGLIAEHSSDDSSTDTEICQTMVSSIQKKCDKPTAMFLGGGTASGKTAMNDTWQKIMEKEDCAYAHLDADDIRTRLQDWEKQTSGDKVKCAANNVHKEASRIAKICVDYMIENKVNFVYDGTMSRFVEIYRLVHKAEKAGYHLTMFATTVDTAEAAKRSISAAEKSKQYVPLCVIAENHAKFSANFQSYMALIPRNKLYDTTEKEPKLVVDNNRAVDAERFKTFLDKSSQTLTSVIGHLDPTVKEQYETMHKECGMCKGENATIPDKDEEICSEVFKDAKTCNKPIAVFVAGGTAAGKSTVFQDDVFKSNACGYGHIDVDDFMKKMSDWEHVTSGDKGKCGGNEVYQRASDLAYKCYLQALEAKKQVAYEGTYSKMDRRLTYRIHKANDSGYDIHLIGVTVKTSVAAERAWKEAESSKQYVPLCAIAGNHAGMAKNYVQLAHMVTSDKLYDNNGDKPVLIMEDDKIVDEKLFDDFKAKANEKYEDVKKEVDKKILDEYEEYHKLCNVCQQH